MRQEEPHSSTKRVWMSPAEFDHKEMAVFYLFNKITNQAKISW
jgi:hypothetical protein